MIAKNRELDEFRPVLMVRLLNKLGRISGALLSHQPLTLENLMQQAERQTGLNDWGQDWQFQQPLQQLLDDAQSLPHLSFIGKQLLKNDVLSGLTNRLYLQQAWQLHPESLQQSITAPFFIMSLPRTGTTFLLTLLSQDPQARAPLQWEMLRPAPMANHATTWQRDPRIRIAEQHAKRFYRFMPRAAAIHYMDPYGPGECRFLLQNSFISKYYFTLLPVHRYNAYLDELSQQEANRYYQYYFKQLQLLDYTFTNQHWVLKAPTHTPFIKNVVSILPDARLIQIHRSPVEFVGSALSGILTVRNCVLNQVDPVQLGQEFLAELEQRMIQYLNGREAVGWDRFCDVSYQQLVSQPLATVESIYDYFGMPLSTTARDNMATWLAENPQHKRGKHHYKLAQFGLNETMVTERFSDYLQRFSSIF